MQPAVWRTSCFVAGWALTGLGLVWLAATTTQPAGWVAELLWIALGMLLVGLAAFVAWQRPGDWTSTIYCLLASITVLAAEAWVGHWRVGHGGLAYLVGPLSAIWLGLAVHWGLLFPRPVQLLRRWPGATLAGLYALSVLGLAAQPGQAIGPGPLGWVQVLGWWALGTLAGALVWVWASVVPRWLRGRTRSQRAQARWMVAASLGGGLPLLYGVARLALAPSGPVDGWGLALVQIGSLVLLTLSAIALTRNRVVWVGRILDRGLFYVGVSFAVTAIYCLMVGLMTAWVGTYLLRWENALAAGLTAMVVVSFLGWIRDRLQQALDRRFLRQKYQLDNAIRRLSRVVDRLVEPQQLAEQLLHSARDAVGAERGAVFLRDKAPDRLSQVAGLGARSFPQQLSLDGPLALELRRQGVVTARPGLAVMPTAAQLQLREFEADLGLALEIDGQLVGMMLLGPHLGGVPYSAEDRTFLQALARTTVLALKSARGHRTIETLKEKLQETVDKLAEQQRRISYLQGELLRRREAPVSVGGPARQSPPEPGTNWGLRGRSPAVLRLLDEVRKVAASPSSVLVRGESGTGKELLARAIHEASPRAAAPFVAVHCGALSAGLLESELFGHVRGAFTGADRDKPGRFELAHHGTLFLDEIGDISLEVQTKLLRVLQERAFERVGGVKRIEVDVRLIAATHQNLEGLIAAGRFREDLFYRLNVISLTVPPLRSRREDVFELAVHFLHRFAERAGKNIERIEPEALDCLAAYDWPGNVRQLENAIERAVVLAEGDSLQVADLPNELRRYRPPGEMPRATRRPPERRKVARAEVLEPAWAYPQGRSTDDDASSERERLQLALAQCQGNKAEAARLLGLPRSTFFSRLRRYGLD